MEFSIATLLANFTNDKLVAAKVLEKKLGCQDAQSLRKLQIALDALEKIGVLVKERGKYRRVTEEGVIEAKLRCSSKGFCFAIQEVEGAEDIYIRESQLSNAWNGDRVLVKLTKEGSRRRSPEGEVRLILERANQSLLARIKQANTNFRAVPLDDRLLFELDIQNSEAILAEIVDHLVHVEILRYPLGQSPPIGRVVQVLGSDAEAATDTDLVCCKHDLPRNFPTAILEAAAGLPTQLSKAELKQRLNMRSRLTISIGGEESATEDINSKLIETAFTLEEKAGHWQVGVHIADVAHYVPPDSPLDRESLKRGSCVYLGEIVLPLLPEAVEQRCSLLPGSDRLAMSVLLTLDAKTGQLIEFEIRPTVIQVDHHVSEREARAILDDLQTSDSELPTPNLPASAVELLKRLFSVSRVAREQRLQRGSFELELPQYQYPYYDEEVLGVTLVTDSLTQSLLTEFSILTNQVVATHLRSLGVPAVYRVQPAPELEEVQELMKLALNLGVELRLDREETVQPQDYQNFTGQFALSTESEQVLTYLLRDTLKPAAYSTTPQAHFGLALSEGYVRCNSPLRRYPDLLIQRILHILFAEGRDRRTTRAKERVDLHHSSSHSGITWNVLPPEVQQELESDLARVILQINEREKEVQDAEADLAGLQKAQLMKERTGEVFQGLITGVQSYGFFVEIEVPDPHGRLLRVEGLVHVSSLKDDWYEYRARQQALFGRKNRAAYRLGDRVAVQVKSVDYYRQQIDLVTVNGSEVNSQDLDYSSSPLDELSHEEADLYSDEE